MRPRVSFKSCPREGASAKLYKKGGSLLYRSQIKFKLFAENLPKTALELKHKGLISAKICANLWGISCWSRFAQNYRISTFSCSNRNGLPMHVILGFQLLPKR